MFCPPSHHVNQGEVGDKHQKVTNQESGSGLMGGPTIQASNSWERLWPGQPASGIWKHLRISCGQRMDTIEMPTDVCVYDTHPRLQVLAQATGIPLERSRRRFSELGTEINA